MIVYDRLWKLLAQRSISVYRLREDCGIDRKTVRRLKANENVETKTIDRICKALSCRVEDIMEYTEG